MLKYIACILSIFVVISSCSHMYISKEQKELIRQIVSNPKDVRAICENSPYEVFDRLKISLKESEQVYTTHFEKYNGKYTFMKMHEGFIENEIKLISVFISDKNHEVSSEFQFKEIKGKLVLYNIVFSQF